MSGRAGIKREGSAEGAALIGMLALVLILEIRTMMDKILEKKSINTTQS